MLTRIALLIASLAAAATLVVASVAVGLWPQGQPSPSPIDAAAAASTNAGDPSPTPQVDTIYLAPPAPQQTITVHRVVSGPVGDDGGEGREGSGDD